MRYVYIIDYKYITNKSFFFQWAHKGFIKGSHNEGRPFGQPPV